MPITILTKMRRGIRKLEILRSRSSKNRSTRTQEEVVYQPPCTASALYSGSQEPPPLAESAQATASPNKIAIKQEPPSETSWQFSTTISHAPSTTNIPNSATMDSPTWGTSTHVASPSQANLGSPEFSAVPKRSFDQACPIETHIITSHMQSASCRQMCRCTTNVVHGWRRFKSLLIRRNDRPEEPSACESQEEEPIPKLRITPEGESPAPTDPPSYCTEELEDDPLAPVRAIPDERFVLLALKHGPLCHYDENGSVVETTAEITYRTYGSNNRVIIVGYNNGSRIAIRIPASAWAQAWSTMDAEALHQQVHLMRYIRKKTDLPVPHVISYDVTFDNALGHPYMLMECIEGRSVADEWFNDEGEGVLEARRQNILRTTAQWMIELRKLQFYSVGALHFDHDDAEPRVVPFVDFSFGEARTEPIEKIDRTRTVYRSSEKRNRALLQRFVEDEIAEHAEHPYMYQETVKRRLRGTKAFFNMIFDYLPFSELTTTSPEEAEETFVIVPPDFDSQNIMCDAHGNVTGFIDWDGVETRPRCAGWASLPMFLTSDWDMRYVYPDRRSNMAMSPQDYDRYRNDYARYLKSACEATGEDLCDDFKYTAKSHIFCRIWDDLGYGGQMNNVLNRIINLFLPRVDSSLHVEDVGTYGWDSGQEQYWRDRLSAFLSC